MYNLPPGSGALGIGIISVLLVWFVISKIIMLATPQDLAGPLGRLLARWQLLDERKRSTLVVGAAITQAGVVTLIAWTTGSRESQLDKFVALVFITCGAAQLVYALTAGGGRHHTRGKGE